MSEPHIPVGQGSLYYVLSSRVDYSCGSPCTPNGCHEMHGYRKVLMVRADSTESAMWKGWAWMHQEDPTNEDEGHLDLDEARSCGDSPILGWEARLATDDDRRMAEIFQMTYAGEVSWDQKPEYDVGLLGGVDVERPDDLLGVKREYLYSEAEGDS